MRTKLLLLSAALLGACNRGDAGAGDLAVPTDGPPPPDLTASAVVDMSPSPDLAMRLPPDVSASGQCGTYSLVTAQITVNALRTDTFRVEYGDDMSYGRSTPAIAPRAGGAATPVTLLGTLAGGTTHYHVIATGPDGQTDDTGDLTVACPALTGPVAQAASHFVVAGNAPTDDFLLLSIQVSGTSVDAMIDRNGRLMWYAPITAPGAFVRAPDGNFVVYRIDQQAFIEVQLDGTVVRSWTDPRARGGADPHEFVPRPDFHGVLFGSKVTPVDVSKFVDGGDPNSFATTFTVAEVDPDAGVSFYWDSVPSVTLAELTSDISLDQLPIDAQHANAILVLSDGNFLVSFRNTDTLYKIDRKTSTILWRLGGKRGDFKFVNDPHGGFSHQHNPTELPNGDLLLFDDGNLHDPPVTRVVQYHLDEQARTATLVWEHHHQPDLFTYCCGSAEREANGDTLTAWGASELVDEIDANGKVLWSLQLAGATFYRAAAVPTLYPPGVQ
jgi:hypothetical protein